MFPPRQQEKQQQQQNFFKDLWALLAVKNTYYYNPWILSFSFSSQDSEQYQFFSRQLKRKCVFVYYVDGKDFYAVPVKILKQSVK